MNGNMIVPILKPRPKLIYKVREPLQINKIGHVGLWRAWDVIILL